MFLSICQSSTMVEYNYVPIRSIKPGTKEELTLMFIVLNVGRPNTTEDQQEVTTVKVADKTGSINISLWNYLGKRDNLSFRIDNRYRLAFNKCIFMATGFGIPFLMVRHQILNNRA